MATITSPSQRTTPPICTTHTAQSSLESLSPTETLQSHASTSTFTGFLPPNQTAAELLNFVAHFDLQQEPYMDIFNIEIQLHRLKTLGRDSAVSNILTNDVLDNLVNRFVLPQISRRTTIEALTIVANALVLNNALLATFDPLPAFPLVLSEYSKPALPLKENYLLGRLLFLFTFNGMDLPPEILTDCIKAIQFKTPIILENVHALTSVVAFNRLIRQAFIELMKFTFNLIHHYPDQTITALEQDVVPELSCIFLCIRTSDLVNVDITRYLFNTLMCVSVDSWFSDPVHMPIILTNILNYCHLVTAPNQTNLHNEQTLSPCFTCLQQLVTHIWDKMDGASSTTAECKALVRAALYPTERDRELAVGNSDSLASYFVKLTTDITVQSCNRIVQDVYWVVFDRNQTLLSETMGFGFAATFLGGSGGDGVSAVSLFGGGAAADQQPRQNSAVSTGGPCPNDEDDDLFSSHAGGSSRSTSFASESMSSPSASFMTSTFMTPGTSATSTTTAAAAAATATNATAAINPITGQYVHAEVRDDRRMQVQREWDALTEEEKEVESERMFTLLDRLKQSGGQVKMAPPTATGNKVTTTTTTTGSAKGMETGTGAGMATTKPIDVPGSKLES